MAVRKWKIRESVIEEENLWNLVEEVATNAARHAINEKYDASCAAQFINAVIKRELHETFGDYIQGTKVQIANLNDAIIRLILRAQRAI